MKVVDLRDSRRARVGATIVVGVLAAVALPLILGGSIYARDVATVALIYALFALSWDFFCGATGELSFGHTFFVGAAAFGTALLQSRLGMSPLVAVVMGALVGGLAGCLIGILTLKHSGAVFTMVTMAAQLSFHRTLFLWSEVFGGEEGVFLTEPWLEDPGLRYAAVATLSVGGLVMAVVVRESRFGRQLRASGGDTRIGLASGVRVPYVRMAGSALSGLLAGVGGSMFAIHNQVANHEMAGDALAGLIFLIAMVGGFGTLIGPWLAGLLYVGVLRELLVPLGEVEPVVVFGLLLVLLWAMPNGFGGLISRFVRPWTSRDRVAE